MHSIRGINARASSLVRLLRIDSKVLCIVLDGVPYQTVELTGARIRSVSRTRRSSHQELLGRCARPMCYLNPPMVPYFNMVPHSRQFNIRPYLRESDGKFMFSPRALTELACAQTGGSMHHMTISVVIHQTRKVPKPLSTYSAALALMTRHHLLLDDGVSSSVVGLIVQGKPPRQYQTVALPCSLITSWIDTTQKSMSRLAARGRWQGFCTMSTNIARQLNRGS